jgi:SNF2 family DNA or RNA helicase
MKRLVLTGTPIQNNLDELYAVVQFVTPGYLGTLQEFKKKYSDNIIASRNKDSNKQQIQKGQDAALSLRNYLANILIRRSRDSILSSILPPRKEYVINCCLTNLQLIQYEDEMNIILNQINNVNKLDNSNNIVDNLIEDTADSTPVVGILPNLMKLRQISDITLKDSNLKEIIINSNNSINKGINELNQKDDYDYYSILKRSGKIKVLESILSSIKQLGKERVVIVSNFTNTLDFIQILAKFRKWPALRLDGSVSADKRLNLVLYFFYHYF